MCSRLLGRDGGCLVAQWSAGCSTGPHCAVGLCRTGASTGSGPWAQTLNTPCQRSLGGAGVIQGPLVGGPSQESLRVAPECFRFGECDGEGSNRGICQDVLRMLGDGPTGVVDVPVHSRLWRSAPDEGGQGSGCCLVVGGL